METIKLDLIPGKKMPSLHASQYDDGRAHGIDLFENGVVYKLDGTETLTINERKGDDCICSLDIENTFTGSNHIVFASTEQMCAVWGNNICELVIKRGNITLGTLNFILEIEPSPTEGGIESESEISNLERQITEITEQVIGDDYYTADQTDEAIATATEGKADTTYVNTELAKKADKTDTYTKTQVDNALNNKMDKANPTGTGSFSLNRKADSTIGTRSFAEGYNNTASGNASHAEGRNTTASGNYSHSEGYQTTASESDSHAEGYQTTASGFYSHAEGYQAIASGSTSHAEGNKSEASGINSHAEGSLTIANHKAQHVFGEFNVADDSTASELNRGNYVEIVGNGTSSNARSNARTLDWQGNETLMGDLTYNGDKSLTSEISRLDGRIDNLPKPVIFKGTLGVGGTVTELPVASESVEGWEFKCITEGTYAGLALKVGDTVTCFNPPNTSVYEWEKTGSQDTDTDTWRAIKINGVEKLGNGISSGAVDFKNTANVQFGFNEDDNSISATLDGIYTESEVDNLLDDKADADNTYTKAQVDDIVYNILPDDTASGAVANFNTSLELPIKSLEIDVNAKQDLHGYDYPWMAGGGKNKCSMPNQTFEQFAEVEIDEIPAGSYVYSAVITSTDTDSDNCAIVFLDENKNTLVSSLLDRSVGNVRVSTSFSVSVPIKFVRLYAGSGYPAGAGDTASFVDNMICLQSASNPTDYAPYENICPISGWSEISLVKCGKNLFDEDTWFLANGYTKNDDGSYYKATNPLNVKLWENKTGYSGQISLSFQYKYDNATQIGFYPIVRYTDGTQSIAYTSPTTTFATRTLTSTSGKIVKEIVSSYGNNIGSTIKDFQIEVGSNVSAFEPYNGTTEVINLGGTYYGGHFTQDKDGHRQFEVTHNYIASYNGEAINEPWISSMDAYSQGATPTTGAQVVYPLGTPIIIPLADGEPIITLAGVNNFCADTGDTEVVFKSSVNDYVNAHSGGNLLGMGGVYLGGAKSGGGEEDTEKTKLDEPKEEVKTIGDTKKLGGE